MSTTTLRRLPATADHTSPHSALRSAVTKRLRSLGAWTYCVAGGPFGRKGAPDVLACLSETPAVGVGAGRMIAVECKTGTGQPTPAQLRELDSLRRAGAVVVIARSVADLDRALAEAGLCASEYLAKEAN